MLSGICAMLRKEVWRPMASWPQSESARTPARKHAEPRNSARRVIGCGITVRAPWTEFSSIVFTTVLVRSSPYRQCANDSPGPFARTLSGRSVITYTPRCQLLSSSNMPDELAIVIGRIGLNVRRHKALDNNLRGEVVKAVTARNLPILSNVARR